jgi:hypothetical protein
MGRNRKTPKAQTQTLIQFVSLIHYFIKVYYGIHDQISLSKNLMGLGISAAAASY